MKYKLIVLLLFVLVVNISFAQTPVKKPEVKTTEVNVEAEKNFLLFPTQNMWTFIKLDTRNGKLWQVQYSVADNNRLEVVLNTNSLTVGQKELPGRFMLYPTQNIYNFLLIDQVLGYVYQVQWSIKEENRTIVQIF